MDHLVIVFFAITITVLFFTIQNKVKLDKKIYLYSLLFLAIVILSYLEPTIKETAIGIISYKDISVTNDNVLLFEAYLFLHFTAFILIYIIIRCLSPIIKIVFGAMIGIVAIFMVVFRVLPLDNNKPDH